jgi:type IV pilus assembly protein PilV
MSRHHLARIQGLCRPDSPRLRGRGFMLIEVLISVVIFSIGILGLVGLQAKMTTAQTEAKARADASYLASELVGLMWADIANLAQYQYSATTSSGNCTGHTACNTWLNKMKTALPSGNATLTPTTSTGDVSITLTWQLPGGSTHTYQTVTTVKGAS